MEDYDYLEAQLEKGAILPPPPAAAEAGQDDAGAQQQTNGDALPPPPSTNGTSSRPRSEERDKDRERDRSRKSRSRSRDRKSSRRDRSRERERSRDRDRSHRSDRERSDKDYRDPPRLARSNRDYPPGGSGGGYRDQHSRDRRQDAGRPQVPRAKPAEPPEHVRQREEEEERNRQQAQLEKAVRTVMAMNLNLRATEKDIFDFFSSAGAINDIRLICDKNTKRSKGICYIEYANVASAMSALVLNGQVMMGIPVMVKPSEANKNVEWEAQQEAKKQQAQMLSSLGSVAPGLRLNPIKLQVLNLHPEVNEDLLTETFGQFGETNYVHIVRDPATNVSSGEAFVQYTDQANADKAIEGFNGMDFLGKKLTVQRAPMAATVLPGPPPLPSGGLPPPPALDGLMGLPLPPPPVMDTAAAVAAAAAAAASFANAAGVMMAAAGVPGGVAAQPAGGPVPEDKTPAVEVDDLDEAENNRSFRLNAQSRAALMSRLAAAAGLQAPQLPGFLTGQGGSAGTQQGGATHQAALEQGLLGPASPIPTPCLLLRNMFTEADKAEATWQQDVEEDVKGESSKFGEVIHCYVDPNSKGHVYLKFATQQAAEAANRALNGRYYSGNQILVSYQFLQPYNSYFSLAK